MLPRFLCPVPASVYDLVSKIIQKKNVILLVSLLHCLYEAEDPSLCQFVEEQLNGLLDFSYTTLSPLDCLSIGYFVNTTTSGTFKVDLASCSIGDQGAKFLATGLKDNISLRELNLSYCELTDRGVESLSTGLNDYIEELRLYGNEEITISGLKTLASHLITLARLRWLGIPNHLKSSINSVFGPVNEVRMRNGLPRIDVRGEWLLYVFVCTLYTDYHSTLCHSTTVVVQQ